MHKPIIYSFFIFLFFACTSEVDLGQFQGEPKLTLYGLISPDKPICVRLSATVSITEKTFPTIEDALIQLYENDVWVGTLTYQSEWEYAIDYHPQAGQTYTIVAEADGFPSIKAVETLPANIEKINVSTMTYQYPTVTLSEYIVGTAEFDLKDDSEDTDNYYEIIPEDNNQPYFSVSNEAVHVDTFREDPMPMESILFTNRVFVGKSIHFSIHVGFGGGYLGTNGMFHYYTRMRIRKVSPAYYDYKNTWYRHRHNKLYFDYDILGNLLDTSSPVKMFSNIENGYGVFASYSEMTITSEQ